MIIYLQSTMMFHRQLLGSSGVLTMLQQSIQELIQMKLPHGQGDTVTIELDGSNLRVSAVGKHDTKKWNSS